jgi:hypothetical protein
MEGEYENTAHNSTLKFWIGVYKGMYFADKKS